MKSSLSRPFCTRSYSFTKCRNSLNQLITRQKAHLYHVLVWVCGWVLSNLRCKYMCCGISSGECRIKTTRLLFPTHGFAGWYVDNKRLNWWGAGSRRERTQWTSITLLRVDWSCLRMRNDGLSLSTEERHLRVGKRGALAASQKAAEVETSTEPLLFGPRCAHHSEMLFRHTAALFTVILHQTERRGLCSYLPSAHLFGNLHSTRLLSQASLAERDSGPDTTRVLKPLLPNFYAMLFLTAVPQLPVCLFLGSWDTEESLLGFLRDDCCLLNNLVQPQKARSSEGQRHSLSKIDCTVSRRYLNSLTLTHHFIQWLTQGRSVYV